MATVNAFDEFYYGLGRGRFIFQTDSFKVMLTNTAPVKGTSAVLADITEIASTSNGYTAGGAAITLGWAETGSGTGIWQLGATDGSSDVTFTQSGANAIGPFQYAVLYRTGTVDSVTAPLIACLNFGSAVTLAGGSGATFVVNAGTSGWIQFTTPTWV